MRMAWRARLGLLSVLIAIGVPLGAMVWVLGGEPTAADRSLAETFRSELLPAVTTPGAKLYADPQHAAPRLVIYGIADTAQQQALVDHARQACGRIAGLPGGRIDFFAAERVVEGRRGKPRRSGEEHLARHDFSC